MAIERRCYWHHKDQAYQRLGAKVRSANAKEFAHRLSYRVIDPRFVDFDLSTAGFISTELAEHLKKMVGFRNIAVHEYQRLQVPITEHINQHRLTDFCDYVAAANQQSSKQLTRILRPYHSCKQSGECKFHVLGLFSNQVILVSKMGSLWHLCANWMLWQSGK